VCGFVVPKTTEHYDLALAYIDASISAEVGASLINEYFLGHPNLDALTMADPETVSTLQLDQLDVRERTRFAAPLTNQQREAFNRIWAEVVAGG
jgi:spermidine/putrescine-binding protein